MNLDPVTPDPVTPDLVTPDAVAILDWYAAHQRDLPWRRPDATPWAVLVSEIMLQQTPVARVLPVYAAWLARWPTPASLAASPAGDAVRAWGRLGYPRRAIRLHATAQALVDRHGGEVPPSADALRELPGIGSYTAAAVASFAFGQRHAVLDTNVRRVLARLVSGHELPSPSPSVAERRLAESLLPEQPAVAARWSVAVMELGALVCTAVRPQCVSCPVAARCAWRAGRAPRGRRPTAQPEVRGHRPAVPRAAAGRASRLRGAGARLATRGRLGGSAAAPPGPGRPGGGRPGRPAAGRTVRAARNGVLVRGDDPLDPRDQSRGPDAWSGGPRKGTAAPRSRDRAPVEVSPAAARPRARPPQHRCRPLQARRPARRPAWARP